MKNKKRDGFVLISLFFVLCILMMVFLSVFMIKMHYMSEDLFNYKLQKQLDIVGIGIGQVLAREMKIIDFKNSYFEEEFLDINISPEIVADILIYGTGGVGGKVDIEISVTDIQYEKTRIIKFIIK